MFKVKDKMQSLQIPLYGGVPMVLQGGVVAVRISNSSVASYTATTPP